MSPTIQRAIAERAREQLGLITRPQLTDLGLSAAAIRHLASGLLEPRGRHTFRLRGCPTSFASDAMEACLDTDGVGTSRTAAQLHVLGSELYGPDIEVLVTRRANRAPRPGVIVRSTTNLPADDIVRVGGVPCLGVARTFLSLAALVPEVSADAIRTAVGDACRERKVSDAWLWWRLERLRCRGRKGVSVLEEILRRRQALGPTESWLEHTFLDLLAAAGLPLPQVQRRIERDGSFAGRVDCLFPDVGLVVELEGHRHHSTPEQRARDEARRRRLILAGVRVMVVTYDELVGHPDQVLADITAALMTFAA